MINLKNIFSKKGDPICVVPSGAIVEGDMTTPHSLRVDGKVVGNIHAEERFVVGRDGQVTGNIDGSDILVQGKVVGNITGSTKVVVTETAIIEGLINTPEKDIRDGAVVKEAIVNPLTNITEHREPALSLKGTSMSPENAEINIVERVEKIWTPVRVVNDNTWF